VLLDLRESAERIIQVGASISWPMSEIQLMTPELIRSYLQKYSKMKVYLHCQTGKRARIAIENFLKKHHSDLIPVDLSAEQIDSMLLNC
jgi:rhodanese-related sulfurtransferase